MLVSVAIVFSAAATFAEQTVVLKTERFDRDPGWEERNNHITPEKLPTVIQDFGYSPTNVAGRAAGELGGRVQRSTTPAYYAARLSPAKSLEDRLTASGSFAITKSDGAAGLFFGFFNSRQPGGSGRPIGSLGMDFDFEHKGGRLAVRVISAENQSGGTFVTPYVPGKFRPTPLRNDGTRYQWTLDYDPAAGAHGQFVFTLKSDEHTRQEYGELTAEAQEEANARFPATTRFVVDVPEGVRKQGATFDRFGMLNMMKAGGAATMYFDDLQYNGVREAFANDPKWEAKGNRARFEDRELVGAHDFGFSAESNNAGGAKGEVGGGLWRCEPLAWYADKVGPLGLDDHLEARGKVKLVTAGPDSDIFLGWFNSESAPRGRADDKDFVGVHIGGPTRVGHYFIPILMTSEGRGAQVDEGPVLVPGRTFDWEVVYDPTANGGRGEVRVKLGEKTARAELKPGLRKDGARLDRFGFFNSTSGGQMVKAYFDNVSYTGFAPK
jgi:hypothetical protein